MAEENTRVKSPSSARRVLIALGAALLLHAVLAGVLVFFSRPKPAQRKASPPLVFELREKRTPPPAAEPKPAESAAAAPKLPAAPAKAVAAHAPKKAAAASGAQASEAPALPKAPEAGQAIAGAQPGAGSDGASTKSWTPGMRLSLELAPGALDGGDGKGPPQLGGLVREMTPEEKLADQKQVVEGRLRGWVKDFSARQRAESRDVYWQGLQDKLAVGPKVEWDVLDKGGRSGGGARIVGEAAQQWQRAASAYGRGGNPFNEGGPGTRQSLGAEANHLAPEDRGFRGDASLGNSLGVPLALGAGSGDGPFSHRLIVFLMITQSADGTVLDVRVQGGSGNHFYDDLALSRARALGKLSLGIPPKDHTQSLWAFETDFTQIPPLPIFGCAMENFIPRDCYYPLKKNVSSKWRLEAVY
jgi:hypothetical protein